MVLQLCPVYTVNSWRVSTSWNEPLCRGCVLELFNLPVLVHVPQQVTLEAHSVRCTQGSYD